MQQLRYSDEIRGFDDVDSSDAEVDEAELALAVQLVEQIASDTFNPEGYSDGVKDQVLAAIEQKSCGPGDDVRRQGRAEGAGHRSDGCPQGKPWGRRRHGSQEDRLGRPTEAQADEEGRVSEGLIGDNLQTQASKEGFIGNTSEEARKREEMSADDERCE